MYAYDLEAARRHIIWYNEMIDVISAAFPHITLQVRYEDVIENPANLLVAAAQLLGLHAPSTQMPALGDDRDCAAPYQLWFRSECRARGARLADDSAHGRALGAVAGHRAD